MESRRSFRYVLANGQYPGLPLDPVFADDYDLELAGLRLWVHGREYLHHTRWDFDDWLWITAHYQTFGASVWTCGPITLTSEFFGFLRELKVMDRDLRGKAKFAGLDPGLKLSLEINQLGQVFFHVEITPDHLTQKHVFDEQIDQSYFRSAIGGLERIVSAYPNSAA
jgi:hypothetical protein